jgi:arthrofactin-type cyclic lipopeptide synthetase C
VEIWEQSAERSLDISPAAVEALDEGGRTALLHDRLVRIGVMPARSTPEVLRGPFRAFATCVRTTYAPLDAYPDPLRLVLVPDPRYDAEENRRRFAEAVAGWGRFAPALELTVGAGNHMTALKPPHVRGLASLLTAGSAG